MNIGDNICTKSSFQGQSTISVSLQLRTRLVDGCPAGWDAWSVLAVVAGMLCSSAVWSGWTTPASHPSGPLVCRGSWTSAVGSPASVLRAIHSLSLLRDLYWQKSFCWYGLFSVWLTPWAGSLQGPRRVSVPWQCLRVSVNPDRRDLEPEAGGQSSQLLHWLSFMGNPHLWLMQLAPHCFIPPGLNQFGGSSLLSWRGWGTITGATDGRLGYCDSIGGSREMRGWSQVGQQPSQVAQPQPERRQGNRPRAGSSAAFPTKTIWCLMSCFLVSSSLPLR